MGEKERDDTVRDADRFPKAASPAAGQRSSGSGQPIGPLAPGAHFGRYEILECIDSGGMGVVYRARHLALGKLVALKVISTSLQFEPRAMDRFMREMQAIGRLEAHPHVLNAYDAGDENGVQYLATEFIEGVQLGELLNRVGPLSVSEACKIISQAALALEHLRTHELVHRDIKPSNLMLTRDGTVKVVDMGLALLRDEQIEPLTSFGETMGSIDYMAPEQWEDSHSVDWRSDIYSLGCTFYCLLAGHPPFRMKNRGSLAKLRAHLEADFPDIRRQRNDVPDQAAQMIAEMVTKEPSRRLTDLPKLSRQLEIIASGDLQGLVARGFDARFRQPAAVVHPPAITVDSIASPADRPAARGEPLSADSGSTAESDAKTKTLQHVSRPASATLTTAPAKSRSNSLPWLAAGAGLCLLGLTAWIFRPAAPAPLPVVDPAVASLTPAAPTSPERMAAPEGDEPARLSEPLAASAPLRFLGQQTTIHDIEFLPPTNRIAAVSKQGLLCLFDLDQPEQPLHSVVVSDQSADSMVYDGSAHTLAIASADGWLRLHAADDGRALRDVAQQSAGLTAIERVPGKNAYATTDWNGDIRQIDLATQPADNTIIAHQSEAVYDVAFSADRAWMAWCGREPAVALVNRTTQQRQDLLGHEDWVVDLAFSPDSKLLASAGHDGTVRIWQLPTGTPLGSIHTVVPNVICFFPDSRYLAIGGRESQVRIWDLQTDQFVLNLLVNNHTDSLAVSADGKRLAAGANDGTLTVWSIQLGSDVPDAR